MLNDNIITEGDYTYSEFLSLGEVMYDFRDNFLTNNTNGDKYIEMYYDLSSEIDHERISFFEYVDIFNKSISLKSKLEFLNNNPSSSSILIDTETYNKMYFLLDFYKAKMKTEESRSRVESLILKLGQFKNKSCAYISNNI